MNSLIITLFVSLFALTATAEEGLKVVCTDASLNAKIEMSIDIENLKIDLDFFKDATSSESESFKAMIDAKMMKFNERYKDVGVFNAIDSDKEGVLITSNDSKDVAFVLDSKLYDMKCVEADQN